MAKTDNFEVERGVLITTLNQRLLLTFLTKPRKRKAIIFDGKFSGYLDDRNMDIIQTKRFAALLTNKMNMAILVQFSGTMFRAKPILHLIV